MKEIETNSYDYLRRRRYVVHEEHEQFIRPETLVEMREYEAVELYSRERIRELSQKGLIKDELKARIKDLLKLRRDHPEGSNAECICMDMITELISKLDLTDFRTLKIERIIDDPIISSNSEKITFKEELTDCDIEILVPFKVSEYLSRKMMISSV